jgi:predicted N-acyltransferase
MSLEIDIVDGLQHVGADEWNALVPADAPFTEYAFLRTLEDTGCVGDRSGWSPAHVLVRRAGVLVGAAPLYAKNNSYGEYIFDWAWANAASQIGVEYYPKLVCAVPFTPATGRRLLVEGQAVEGAVVDALIAGMSAVAQQLDASSLHLLFVAEEEHAALKAHDGLLPRLTYQYHWQNDGSWTSWDDFMCALRAPSRRKINKERREAASAGLTVEVLQGEAITADVAAAMYRFYRDTTWRKGAIPYLTEAFFMALAGPLQHLAVIHQCSDDGRPVAGSLSFQKGDHLYGRYWGCLEAYDKLHFEVCYYRHIELCLQKGWSRFEAGAQGQHKIKRGLMPTPTYSMHWLRDGQLRDAVADFLPREAHAHTREMQALAERGPFKRG